MSGGLSWDVLRQAGMIAMADASEPAGALAEPAVTESTVVITGPSAVLGPRPATATAPTIGASHVTWKAYEIHGVGSIE